MTNQSSSAADQFRPNGQSGIVKAATDAAERNENGKYSHTQPHTATHRHTHSRHAEKELGDMVIGQSARQEGVGVSQGGDGLVCSAV